MIELPSDCYLDLADLMPASGLVEPLYEVGVLTETDVLARRRLTSRRGLRLSEADEVLASLQKSGACASILRAEKAGCDFGVRHYAGYANVEYLIHLTPKHAQASTLERGADFAAFDRSLQGAIAAGYCELPATNDPRQACELKIVEDKTALWVAGRARGSVAMDPLTALQFAQKFNEAGYCPRVDLSAIGGRLSSGAYAELTTLVAFEGFKYASVAALKDLPDLRSRYRLSVPDWAPSVPCAITLSNPDGDTRIEVLLNGVPVTFALGVEHAFQAVEWLKQTLSDRVCKVI